MKFEETYKKYKEGTATEEEKSFVEEEIAKAKQISQLLDKAEDGKQTAEEIEDITVPADEKEFKKAKKAFKRHSTVKIIVIVLCCILGISLIAVGTVWGVSTYSAKNAATITQDEAIELAKACVADYSNTAVEKLVVGEVEKDLESHIKLTDAKYIYEIEIFDGGCKYEIEVNSVSGYAHITDIDGYDVRRGKGPQFEGGYDYDDDRYDRDDDRFEYDD